MLDTLKNINHQTKRKIALVTFTILAAGHTFLFKSFVAKYFGIEIWGQIDVGTVVGAIGLFAVWMFYKKQF